MITTQINFPTKKDGKFLIENCWVTAPRYRDGANTSHTITFALHPFYRKGGKFIFKPPPHFFPYRIFLNTLLKNQAAHLLASSGSHAETFKWPSPYYTAGLNCLPGISGIWGTRTGWNFKARCQLEQRCFCKSISLWFILNYSLGQLVKVLKRVGNKTKEQPVLTTELQHSEKVFGHLVNSAKILQMSVCHNKITTFFCLQKICITLETISCFKQNIHFE